MRTGLSVSEAHHAILGVTPVLGAETLTTRGAQGRVLAEPVFSDRTLPPADCSAMDGYAVRCADLAGASASSPVWLRVAFEVPAGAQADRTLESQQAARIFTGAPIPPGADTVVKQEDTDAGEGGRVAFRVEPGSRDHVRDTGEDLRSGDRVLEPGTVLGSAELGLLASLGRSVVAVRQAPRVAILSGGDELVEPDGDPSGGRIVSSNSYTLAAQCREIGAEPIYLGIARDDPDDIEVHLRAGMRADCIVSSAGVSVGDHDHVRSVLEKLGCRLEFWGVEMKPGYPLAFGGFGDDPSDRRPLVFGLPGNPVSASVTFDQFVRPALRKMMGHKTLFRPTIRARLGEGLEKKAGRLHFVRVRLDRDEAGELVASSTGSQSSGVLTSLTAAQGLLIFPADETSLVAGQSVVVQVLDNDVFGGHSAGF
ncbi:MAG: gephyrin-like molybdotransferase Glp [Myxococcota bacterium]|nr:gephyrin-like molybdotransferase Glp [Myxococcota bacterium]